MNGWIALWISASRLLCAEQPATILPPLYDRVLIHSVHGEEGLLTDGLWSMCLSGTETATAGLS